MFVIPAAGAAPTPQPSAPAPAPAPAPPPPSGGLELDLAPEPEPEPQPEPEFDEHEPEPEPEPRRGRRRGGEKKRRRKPPSRDESRSRGSVQVFEALKCGVVDFKNNALFCLLAMLIFEVLTTVVGVVVGIGAGLVVGIVVGTTGSLPGLVIVVLGAVAIGMAVVAYLLQGLFAFWLACAREEEASLGLLFSPPLAGGISGAMVQVAISIAYLGLCFGIGWFVNTVGSVPGAIVGFVLFFTCCCLLVLISGIAQIYIVDRGHDFANALGAAIEAVMSHKAKLLGYAAICLGAVFLVLLVVGFVLSVLGISPDPLDPAFGKIVLSALIQSAVSLSLVSIMGTSLTHVYLQLSGR